MSSQLAVEQYERQIAAALARARALLDREKHPELASAVPHAYEDKYRLAENAVNAALASHCRSLLAGGLATPAQLAALARAARAGERVVLRYRSEERCGYAGARAREEEAPTREVAEASVGGRVAAAFTHKVVTKVTEHAWRVEYAYAVVAVRGDGAADDATVELCGGARRGERVTATERAPRAPPAMVPARVE